MIAENKYYWVGPLVYAFLADGSEDAFIPEGAVPLTAEEVHKVLNPPPHEPTREDVEAARQAAYADPETGSDRLFAQASRMKMMGESGWEELLEEAKARYLAIQAEWPWPIPAAVDES